jgi:hypothetical protein
MSLLTAIVPVHKMAGRLDNLKQWVGESLRLNIRIVLVHDFGDVETEQELKNFVESQKHQNLFFITGNYGGPGLARNAGMPLIDTEYFCFWDSDDIPLVQNFYLMVCHAVENEIEIAVGEYKSSDNKLSQRKKSASATCQLTNQVALSPGLWRMAFQSTKFIERRFRNLRLAEDQLYLVDLDFAEHKINFFPKVVYRYNLESPNSLTKQRVNLTHITTSLQVIRDRIFSVTSIKSREFVLVVWLKQSLTLLKLGNFKLKRVGLSNVLRIMLNSSPREVTNLVRLMISQQREN